MRTAAETLAQLEDLFEALIALPPGPEQQAEARRLARRCPSPRTDPE